MIRVCCSGFHKGDRRFGEKPPFENVSETHGFCDPCLQKEMTKLNKIVMVDLCQRELNECADCMECWTDRD